MSAIALSVSSLQGFLNALAMNERELQKFIVSIAKYLCFNKVQVDSSQNVMSDCSQNVMMDCPSRSTTPCTSPTSSPTATLQVYASNDENC